MLSVNAANLEKEAAAVAAAAAIFCVLDAISQSCLFSKIKIPLCGQIEIK